VVLAMGMGALALGAALVPRVLSASPYALLWTLAAASASTVWLAYCAPLLDLAQPLGDIAVAAALVIPALAPLGGVLPLVYRGAAGEGGRRLGSLLACEIPGAIVIAPAMHAFVLPSVGVSGVCAVCSGLGALCCASFAVQRGSRGAAVVATVVCAALAALAGVAPPAALRSPRWNDAALTVRAFQEDREFAVAVVDDGLQGERTLLTDQFRAAGTGRDYQYMRALGHLPVLLHRAPERVAVLALGTGTTLGSVSLHSEVAHIEVLEISAAVVRMAPWFAEVNRGALAGADARVNVVIDDGRRTLARRAGRFDVITMEPLLPDSPFGVYLYTPEFYAVARAALAPRGILCQWVPPHALEPEVFDAVVAAFSRSFEHTQAWLFGTQLILVASEHAIELEPARWTSLEGVLAAELTQLGFDDYGGVRARFVGALSRRSVSRPLTDLDPWIAWRHKPADARSLSWLPRNLEQVASWSTPPPWPPLSDADEARRDAARTLREARIAAAWSEVELRAGRLDAPVAHDRALAALEPLAPAQRGEREVAAFVENIEYLARLRSGVARLAAGDARAALADLVRAAELRGERAEVHAYVAAALEVTGREPAARAAWSKARELCPGLERTPAGIRARALGARGASQDVEHAASVQR
jgi:spermidine synthase